MKTSNFYAYKMVVKDFFGLRKRTFHYQEIEQWVCEKKSNKYTKWSQLIVWFSSGEKIKWYSTDYHNFDKILRQISSHKTENKALKTQRERISDRKIAILPLLVGIFFFYHFYNDINLDLSSQNLVQITGKIAKIEERRGKKQAFLGYTLKLKEYPDYDFNIAKNFSDERLKSDLEHRENISITLLKSQFDAKILRNENASFIDLYLFPYEMAVVGVDGHFSSLDYERTEKKDKKTDQYLFLLLSLGAFAVAIFLADFPFLRKNKS